MEHYRCFKTYIPAIRVERIADTLYWFPSQVVLLIASSSDAACAATLDLISALRKPSSVSVLSPLSGSEQSTLAQLAQLAEIFAARYPGPTVVTPSATSTDQPIIMVQQRMPNAPIYLHLATPVQTFIPPSAMLDAVQPDLVAAQRVQTAPMLFQQGPPATPTQPSGNPSVMPHDNPVIAPYHLRFLGQDMASRRGRKQRQQENRSLLMPN
jgi:hypothetical protein